jgi:hypothetical protein
VQVMEGGHFQVSACHPLGFVASFAISVTLLLSPVANQCGGLPCREMKSWTLIVVNGTDGAKRR